MQFTPKSAEELTHEREEARKLLKPGPGQFTVLTGETKNKEGVEYHLLTLDVWDSEGNQKQIDWVCLHPKALHFVRSFCYATGLEDSYETGTLTLDECLGKSGNCEIGIAKGEPDGKGGRYPDKNKVKDFTPAQRSAPSHPAASTGTAARAAYTAFGQEMMTRGISGADSDTAWKSSVANYFNRKPAASITEKEWGAFVRDGFKKKELEFPASGGPGIPDDEIPFAPNLA